MNYSTLTQSVKQQHGLQLNRSQDRGYVGTMIPSRPQHPTHRTQDEAFGHTSHLSMKIRLKYLACRRRLEIHQSPTG